MNLKKMTIAELQSEQDRLTAGNVGVGFDKQYLSQALKLVGDELKEKTRIQEITRESKPKKA